MDPLAEKFVGRSPYEYCFNNPINLIDPTGMGPEDFTILLAKNGADGYGHMGAVIQDGEGAYYYVTMGAAENGLSKMSTVGVQGGMNVVPLSGATSMDEAIEMAKQDKNNSQYTDQIKFKTTKEQDAKIYKETVKKADRINSGEEKYHVFNNNCTDACEEPITNATGVKLSDAVKPNSNFKEVKQNKSNIQKKLDMPEKNDNPGALKPWEPKY